MDCCDLVVEEVVVDMCLHGMMEEYMIFLGKICLTFLFTGRRKPFDAPKSQFEGPQGPVSRVEPVL